MSKAALTSNLLKVKGIGHGYILLKDPDRFVTVYRVTGGANPWIEDPASTRSHLSQWEGILGQLRPGEEIQLLLRRLPLNPSRLLDEFRAKVHPEAPEEFRGRYAEYYEEWFKVWTASERLSTYETYVLFTIRNESSLLVEGMLGSGRRSRREHLNLDLIRSRARTWTQHLCILGLQAEELDTQEIAGLIYSEFTLGQDTFEMDESPEESITGIGEDAYKPLSDRISEVSLDFSDDHYKVGDRFARSFYVTEYPDIDYDPMFLSGFLTQRDDFRISIFARGVDQAGARSRIERQLKGDLGTLQKGNLVNVDSQAQLEARQGVLEQVARGETRLVNYSIYVTAIADDYDRLMEIADTFSARFPDVHRYQGYFEQKRLFLSTLPLGDNAARREHLTTTRDLSNAWPFFEEEICKGEGVPLGFSSSNQVVPVDPWNSRLENWNTVVIGQAGSGKSFSILQQIIRHLPFNPFIMVIDKSKSYEFTCRAAGGKYVHIDLESDLNINVFDTDVEELKRNEGLVPNDKVSDLLGFLNVILAEEGEARLSNLAMAHLEEAIKATYLRTWSRKGKETPTLSDLKETLSGMATDKAPEEFRILCRRYTKILEPFTGNGTYSNLTDRSTNVQTDSHFIVFDTSRLPETGNLLALGVYIISQFCLNKAQENKRRGRRSWLLLDETWFLARFPAGVSFLLNLAKRSRHMALATMFATQQIADFLKNPDVRPVVDNAATKYLFKPGASEIDVLTDILGLNERERYTVASLHQLRGAYSQCFALMGSRRGLVYVTPDPVSYWIATSHPDESRERERYIAENSQEGDLEGLWTALFTLVKNKMKG